MVGKPPDAQVVSYNPSLAKHYGRCHRLVSSSVETLTGSISNILILLFNFWWVDNAGMGPSNNTGMKRRGVYLAQKYRPQRTCSTAAPGWGRRNKTHRARRRIASVSCVAFVVLGVASLPVRKQPPLVAFPMHIGLAQIQPASAQRTFNPLLPKCMFSDGLPVKWPLRGCSCSASSSASAGPAIGPRRRRRRERRCG